MAGYQHESINVQDTETRNNNIHKEHEQSNKKPVSNKQNKNNLTAFHQNICGLINKKEELLNSLTKNSPQTICITEHHLTGEDSEGITTLHPYTSGAKFCRRMHKCGGVYIY